MKPILGASTLRVDAPERAGSQQFAVRRQRDSKGQVITTPCGQHPERPSNVRVRRSSRSVHPSCALPRGPNGSGRAEPRQPRAGAEARVSLFESGGSRKGACDEGRPRAAFTLTGRLQTLEAERRGSLAGCGS